MSQELEVRVMRAGEEGDMPLMLAEDVADEIRRLRSVAQAETEMRVGTFDTITQLQNQLDAETKLHLENESRHMALAMGWKNRIERLEGALTALVDDCPDCEGEGGWPEVPRIDTNDPLLPAVACRRCAPARAALEEKL